MNHEQLQAINAYLDGVITFGHLTAGLFFLRFWKRSGDRLFVMLATSFWLLGSVRVLMIFRTSEEHPFYWFRLIAYLIILAAIIDKNFRKSTTHTN
jgi:hypothetical protein